MKDNQPKTQEETDKEMQIVASKLKSATAPELLSVFFELFTNLQCGMETARAAMQESQEALEHMQWVDKEFCFDYDEKVKNLQLQSATCVSMIRTCDKIFNDVCESVTRNISDK